MAKSSIQIFTDASVQINATSGSCAFWCPTYKHESNIPPVFPLTSTHCELQAILHALIFYSTASHISLFTDSKSALQLIAGFQLLPNSQQIQHPYYGTLSIIREIMSNRYKDNNTHVFNHVYSHLLDDRSNINLETKAKRLAIMKSKYPSCWEYLLKQNQKADEVAGKRLHKCQFPSGFLARFPNVVILEQGNMSPILCPSIFIHTKDINNAIIDFTCHAPTRSEWFNNPLVNVSDTINSRSAKFQLIFDKLINSFMLTGERAFSFYKKPHVKLSNQQLQKLKQIYDSPNCPFCPHQAIENHQHVSSDCVITNFIHNKLVYHITHIIATTINSDNFHFIPWFTTSLQGNVNLTSPLWSFPKYLGDRGIIPKALRSFILSLNTTKHTELLKSIIHTTHNHIAAKWSLRKIMRYHNLTLEQAYNEKKIRTYLNLP
jgi:ribonuclease HI